MSKLILPKGMGKNSAKTDREELDIRESKSALGNHHTMLSGAAFKPPGAKYLGSAVVHYYEGVFSDDNAPRFQTVTQCLVMDVPEGLADFGHKELQRALMRTYGREVKK